MGNQQAAFYYGLNYDATAATNDSGYFDDDVFGGGGDMNDDKKEEKFIDSNKNNQSKVERINSKTKKLVNGEENLCNNKKSFTKSRSIEIVVPNETSSSKNRANRTRNNMKDNDELNETVIESNESSFENNKQVKGKNTLPMSILKNGAHNQEYHSVISSSWSPSGGLSDYENSKKDRIDEEPNEESEEELKKPKRPASTTSKNEKSSSTNSTPTSISTSRSWLRGMNYIGKMARGVKDFYNEMNSATLTGAIDVVVVKQPDGSFKSTPFHVRFGKMALIKTKGLTVDIEINGQPVDLHMRLGEAGEAYFVYDENDESLSSMSSSCESLSDDALRLNRTVSFESNEDESSMRRGTLIPTNEEIIDTASNGLRSTSRVKFYSDGETSTPESMSPSSRPMSPSNQSDENNNSRMIQRTESSTTQWNWNWGQLPEKEKKKKNYANKKPSSQLVAKDSSSTLYPGMQPDEIYLDETENLDAEMADLYLNQKSDSPKRTIKPRFSSQNSSTSSNKEELKKTRLLSDQIAQLNLNPGANEIIYSVTTALQGTTKITSYIFLWNNDDKVIISDIDGTITISDVWGQVLPIFGRDWTQAGVADLYSAIEKNQYKFMYLSARAIGQSRITRDLLKNVNQGGLTLPKGPLLVTPTSLFTAFQKEVIEKKPEEFKISCLQDVRSLFPKDHNPFYAGYGNKTSDVTAYKTVGVPVSRIFTINPQGELKHEVSRTFQSSYSNLCDFVDLIFPPLKPSAAIIKAEYDSFNFWRTSSLVVNDPDLIAEIELEMKKSSQVGSGGGGGGGGENGKSKKQ